MDFKASKLLERFQQFPVNLTIEDPASKQPTSISYENLHELLLIGDATTDQFVLGNLYAEMGRWERYSEWEAAKADAAYNRWQARMAEECAAQTPEKKTASGKPAAKQGPTQDQIKSYYRLKDEYEQMRLEPVRLRAISGLFHDLKMAFHMKSKHVDRMNSDSGRYERVARAEDSMSYHAKMRDELHAMAAKAEE